MPMLAPRWNDPDRVKSALAAVLVQVVLGYALLVGLAVHLPPAVRDELKVFGVAPPPPPPRETPEPRHAASHKKEGAAAPPNLRAHASEIVAPPPVLLPAPPPPLVAAPKPFQGNQTSQGAAPIAGSGTGAGGAGNGTGSGGAGDGEGGETPLVLLKGRLLDSDYPREAPQDDQARVVYLRFTVGVKGRVTDCTITRSSGSAVLDATTCRLIQQRFRYRPTLDAAGRPIPDTVLGEHRWNVRLEPPEEEERR